MAAAVAAPSFFQKLNPFHKAEPTPPPPPASVGERVLGEAGAAANHAMEVAPTLWARLVELKDAWQPALSKIVSVAMGIFSNGWAEMKENFSALMACVGIVKDASEADELNSSKEKPKT